MPYASFASNFLWVMVIGLLGPSIPAMVSDLGISYAQAGFFFSLLSLGSLFGTSLGGIASDFLPRKALYGTCLVVLALGLFALGFMPVYALIALCIFLLSLMGSPIGAVGQSIMLDMFPSKREKYISIQTLFSAMGSLLAPILVSLNFSASLSWRWPFMETALLALALFVAIMALSIPKAVRSPHRQGMLSIARNTSVLFCAILIFFSIAVDLGFSYWLAEYFKTELHVSLRLSSAVVGIYLIGVIVGRMIVPAALKRARPVTIQMAGLTVSLAAILAFIFVPVVAVKAALCAIYGLGIGPLFPLLMARGSREFPAQSGAVTGVLFGAMSLGGVVFPLLVGSLASRVGIAHSYFFCAAVVLGILVTLFVDTTVRRRRGAEPAR